MDRRVIDLDSCGALAMTLRAKPARTLRVGALLLATLLVVAAVWAAAAQINLVVKADGRLRAAESEARVSSPTSRWIDTKVTEIFASEGDRVSAGEPVLKLDDARLVAEIERVERALAASKDELARTEDLSRLQAGLDEAKRQKATRELEAARSQRAELIGRRAGEAALAQADLEALEGRLEALQELARDGIAARADLVDLESEVRRVRESLRLAELPLSEERVMVLEDNLNLLERQRVLTAEELSMKLEVQRTEIAAREQELEQLETARAMATLIAPISGVLVEQPLVGGDVLSPGEVAFVIAPREGLRMEIDVPGEEVVWLEQGLTARVRLSSPEEEARTIEGHVSFIAPDARSSATEDLYRVHIELLMGAEELRELRLGRAGEVVVHTGQATVLDVLAGKVRQSISL